MSDTQNWHDRVKVHPAADLFPLMTDAEIDELAADIEANGLQAPIVYWTPNLDWRARGDRVKKDAEIYLLDGRNRLETISRISPEAWARSCYGELPNFIITPGELLPGDGQLVRVESGGDPYAYVVSANLRRRHLTVAQRKELAAKILAANPRKSNRQVAKQVKLSDKTVAGVRREAEGRAEIPHTETRTDTKGRAQSATKSKSQIDPTTVQGGVETAAAEPTQHHDFRVPDDPTPHHDSPAARCGVLYDGADGKWMTFDKAQHMIEHHLQPEHWSALLAWLEEMILALPAAAPSAQETTSGGIEQPQPEHAPVAGSAAPPGDKGWAGTKPPCVCNNKGGVCGLSSCKSIGCCQRPANPQGRAA